MLVVHIGNVVVEVRMLLNIGNVVVLIAWQWRDAVLV